MTVALDPPLRTPGGTVATVSRSHVRRLGASVFCGKTPLAVLVERDGEVSALGLDGRPLSAEDVEALCPGALARFEHLAARTSG